MLGWIFGGFVKKLERAANDISHNFVKASGEEIDRLFDERLSPLADKLDYIAQQRIKESRLEIEALENKTKADIESLLAQADEKAKQNLEKIDLVRQESLADVRATLSQTDAYLENRINQISLAVMEALEFTNYRVDKALLEVKDLENKLFVDANYLVDKLIQQIDEVLEGKIEKFNTILQRYLDHALPGPFDKCKRRLNIQWKFGNQISDMDLYRLAECYELSKLDENTSIEKVVEIYGQLQLNAARMAALVRNAPILKRIAVDDWLKYGVLSEFWYDTLKAYDSNVPMLKPSIRQALLTDSNDND
ncbi:hypothetical protein [Aerosakkonema funiforme]|uniref:Uncharacterized protein n=2 Tax=Oscillatoriophycideae TaxID=1301283 RepID=A0A926ZFK1_9CYAN|nr:hypothetical protein [Aerosakkonema funiforme]MBD2181223.1 hypothetical protein [Aerosakkonema funiforme FACHB-1375]